MNLLDSTMQLAIPAFGLSSRWLRDELQARGVTVHVTEAGLRELAADAESAARLPPASGEVEQPYADRLRHQVALRADFIRAWTLSDDAVDIDDALSEHLVKIARKYALPRAWRLTEPVATPSLHPTPTYLYWASAS